METKKKKTGRRKAMTLLLDKDTIAMLEDYSEMKLGSINYSQAVRAIVREYYERNKRTELQTFKK